MSNEWWRGAVVYQIYPRSFKDNNGDGIGDLSGITEKLDYVASLGVDAIWISPFFKSPMKDYGYDVADYRDIDPMFGTLDDFRVLLEKAHSLNLKIILDLVLSHTSDQHAWFQESRQSRSNPKSDWYVWADPKPDGSPPNNWQAFFGGSSWTYDVRRGQYYMHNFLSSQPDLNMHNPEVQEAALNIFRFWMDFGVDGFRLDVANCYMHDRSLRDNPISPDAKPQFFNVAFPTPFTMQKHTYDFSQPENLQFIERIRDTLNEYNDRMALAEIAFCDDTEQVSLDYTRGVDRLHTAYSFMLISGDKPSASYIRDAVQKLLDLGDDGWPSWAFSNHDVVRVMSRWGRAVGGDPRLAKTLIALLGSLRGTVFLYQGEELGLPDAEIPFDRIEDPWGKYLYPLWQGRDGCRTPMPWGDEPMGGFTHAPDAWLPMPDIHRTMSVGVQEKDPQSTLAFTRSFMAWRRSQPVLRTGGIAFVETGRDDVLAYYRGDILCQFNLGPEPAAGLEPFEARFSTGETVLFTSL